MGQSRTELKAKLMAEAERVIDELLDWHVSTAKPNLAQVEEKVLGLRQDLSEQMSQTVIEAQAAASAWSKVSAVWGGNEIQGAENIAGE